MQTSKKSPGRIVPAGPGKKIQSGRGHGQWRTYEVVDGLAGAEVKVALQDREGNLWVGTVSYGLSRFDGRTWKTFTTRDGLSGNSVVALLQDRRGRLWIGTSEGVDLYDGDNIRSLSDEHTCHVNNFYQNRDGQVWMATLDSGAVCYDGKGWTFFTTKDGLASDNVRCIHQDREGCLWLATTAGLSRYDGRTWRTFTMADGLASDDVRYIHQDREGCLWLATTAGLSRYDGQTWRTFTMADGLAADDVRYIHQDREGYLWLATWGRGAICYDGEHRADADVLFTTFTAQDGLGNDYISSILEDREGNMWFATLGGLSRYSRESVVSFLAGHIVLCLCEDRAGQLWLGTNGGGLIRYDGECFTAFAQADGLPDDCVWCIAEDRDGCLWLGTSGGFLVCYDGEHFTTYEIENERGVDDEVRSVFVDRDGALWCGTWRGDGLIRYDGACFETFTTQDGLPHNNALAIGEDAAGTLWFGTWGGGACRYDGVGFATLATADGLADDRVRCVFSARDGDMWFATALGVSHYHDGIFATFTSYEGLAHDEVRAVCDDRDGHLWFGTYGGGVNRWDGVLFQTLIREDGLAHNQVTAILQDRTGAMWFGTLNGVTRYRPLEPVPPLVRIEEVVADQRYARPETVTVPASVPRIEFKFHGASYKTRPGGMVYQYRLRGLQEQWQQTRVDEVEYQALKPGEYVFEVRAIDRDLVYSESATVTLSVIPDPHIEALSEVLRGDGGEFVGRSPALRRMQGQLEQVADSEMTVLILGETGAGKGLAARTMHALSTRREGLFVQVNCGAIPEGLVESELFGHERGAFTGAVSRKLGKVELASGGTLFLDEIGDLTLAAQAKLLELLEERIFVRVGGTGTLSADARVVAATNRDLQQMVAEGAFREDLYFRLSGFPLQMPPLRERLEDIPLLATYFAQRMANHLHKRIEALGAEALIRLEAYEWPGNVRELEHVMQRAVIVCREPAIQAEDIALGMELEVEDIAGAVLTLEEQERRYIRQILERTDGVVSGKVGAALLLGVPESTLRSRMKKLGIERK